MTKLAACSFVYPTEHTPFVCPVLDQTSTPSGNASAFAGAMTVDVVSEGTVPSATKPQFKQLSIPLKKILAYVPVTNEVLAYSALSIGPILSDLFGQIYRNFIDAAVLISNGLGASTSVIGAACSIAVNRTTSNQVKIADLANMVSRLAPGSMDNACWFVHPYRSVG